MFSLIKKKIGARLPFLKLSDRRFLEMAYQEILGRAIDRDGLEIYTRLLNGGRSRWEVILYLIRSEELIHKMIRENAELTSDRTFLERVYPIFYHREIDPDGLETYSRLLRSGHDRISLLSILAESPEFIDRLLRRYIALKDIRALKPEAYRVLPDLWTKEEVLVYEAAGESDFDWLEKMILETDYYERPGIWSFELDSDKKLMAEFVAYWSPRQVLEIGCSNGAVLQCLAGKGIAVEGLEISAMARNRAAPEIRDRIRLGDLLELPLPAHYDLIFGLDVFEHLNPNKIRAYVQRMVDLLVPGGYLFGNIPAFGEDPVFGNLFPLYLEPWEKDGSAGRPFHTLHVDPWGYPLHGHLIWADSAWWVRLFEEAGLERVAEIERALHRKYDAYLEERAPARKSFYVFFKNGAREKNRMIVETIEKTPSAVLEGRWGHSARQPNVSCKGVVGQTLGGADLSGL